MKNLFLILSLFVSAVAFGQPKVLQTLGNKNNEIKISGAASIDSFIKIPIDTLNSAPNGSIAIKDTLAYIKINRWIPVGRPNVIGYGLILSGNTLRVDTSWNGLQTKADATRRLDSLPKYYPTALDFTNDILTVSINGRPDLTVEIPLSSKLSPTDTTNKWVNRITKEGDSVFYYKGSSRYFVYKAEAVSDGNNYTTSVTYFDDTLNVQRDGLSEFNVPLPFSTKLNISDTADMLSTYINAPGYGLLKDGQNLVVDTATIVSKLYLSWLPSYNVSSTDINNWNTAYNKRLVGVSVTGSSTKTIQATLADGTQLSTSFIDNTGGDSSRGMNINTDTTAAQILTTGTDGNDFNIESNGLGVHAFNLPFASNTSIGKLDSSYFRKFDSVYAVIKSGVVTRARGAISLTTTGTTGASTYDNLTGVLNIPNYTNGSYSWSGATLGTSYSSTSLTIDANAVAWSFTGSSPATWTLPSYGTFTNRAIWIKNIGSATLTVQRAGTDQIYTTTSVTSIAVEPGESVCIMAAANGLSPNTWSVLFDGSGGSTNSNIGSGFRLAVPYTNNLKTLFPGYGFLMDSTTNTNGITLKLDTTTLDTRYLSSISVQDSTFDLDASSGIIKVRPYAAKKGSNPGYPYFYNDGAYTGANNFPSYYNELWLDGNLNTGILRWSYQGTEIGRLSSSISGSNKGGNVTLRAPVSSNYFQTIVGQESLGSSTTLRLPNTGNATDTLATLHDVRAGGGSGGISESRFLDSIAAVNQRIDSSGFAADTSTIQVLDGGINKDTIRVNTNNVALKSWTYEKLDSLAATLAGGGAWGDITGTLSDQTDLQAALNAKLNISDTTNKWLNDMRRRSGTDTVEKYKNGSWQYAYKDSVGGGNLIVVPLGATGINTVEARNDSLRPRKIVAGFGTKIDTLSTGELRSEIDSTSAAFKAYIALYGNDGGGGSDVIDSIQYAANDTVATGNIYINTTTNRLRFKGDDGRWRGVAITDSSGVFVDMDADALTYFSAVATADGSLTDDQKGYINTFILNLKAHGLWTKITAFYLPIYTTASPSGINLKAPGTYNLSWSATWTYSTSGATPGSSQFANTGITPSSVLSQNNIHVAVYTATSTLVNTFESLIGANDASYYLQLMWNGGTVYANANSGQNSEGALAAGAGFDIMSRTGSTTVNVYRNGTSVKSSTTASTGLPTTPIYISATRNQFGAFTYPSTRKWQAASIGAGLSGSEAADFNTDLEELMDNLGIGNQ